jgi:small-conductance mechanosensitive channel
MWSRHALLFSMVFAAGIGGGRDLRAQDRAAAASDAEVATAPVAIDGVVLFQVRGVSSFPAGARASLIAERLAAVASDPAIPAPALQAVESDGLVRIVAGDRPVMVVTEADAVLEGVRQRELAATHVLRLRQAMIEYRAARSPAALWRSAVVTGYATAALVVVVALLFWFWRWFDGLLRRRVEARIHSVGIQSFEVVRAERIRSALQSTLRGVRAVVYLAGLLVYAGFVLAQWPWTRALSAGATGFALAPLRTIAGGIAANVPSLVFLAVLFVLLRVTLRLTRLFFEAVERGTVTVGGFDAEWSQPTYKIVRIAIVAFALIVAYPYIPGSESAAFKGVSVFIGIVFSLGSSSAIANIIAGYMMTYRRAFKVGDRVRIGDAVGDVIETRLQVTHLRSYKNEEIVIPNAQILNGEVLNYSSLAKEHGLILHTEVGIGYETAWRQVEEMLLAAARRTPGLGTVPAPFVLVKKLGDFAVTYELNVPCAEVKTMNALYTALHHNVLDVFNEHGVQIMTPAYEGDPAEPKIAKEWHVTAST